MTTCTPTKIAALMILVVLGGCSRLVSTDPLLAQSPPSKERWAGAYTGELGEKTGRIEMLLQLREESGGRYAMTIHSRGQGKSLLSGEGSLSLIGLGEVRIVDLGDNYAVAQTRCEIASSPGARWAQVGEKWKNVLEAAKTLSELDAKDEATPPASQFLGPYVYPLILARGDEVLTLLGTSQSDAREAVGEASIGLDEIGGIADGSGLLVGANAIFEKGDLYIQPGADSAALLGFFKRLAQREFEGDETPDNAVSWRKLSPQKLKTLELADQFPAQGWTRMWCNLSAASASED